MNINLVCPIIVLTNETNPNIRKSDFQKLMLLVDKNNNLVNIKVNSKNTLKSLLRKK